MSEQREAAAWPIGPAAWENSSTGPSGLATRGCFVTDLQRRVVSFNRAAGEMLASHQGICLRSGILYAINSGDERALNAAFLEISPGCEKFVVIRAAGCDLMKIRLNLLEGGLHCLLEFECVLLPSENAIPEMEHIYGLTRMEARVLGALATGLSPEQAARKFGMAEATARTHTKRLYAKVEVSTRGELMALLLSLK